MNKEHVPILTKEIINFIKPQKNQTIIDCTLGSGGHSLAISKKTNNQAKILAIDYDKQNIKNFQSIKTENITTVFDNFKNIKSILERNNISQVDSFLLDLGFSSDQLNREIGLSFLQNEDLDMRINQSEELPKAREIINNKNKKDLIKIFKNLGEVDKAEKISQEIINHRKKEEIKTTNQLKKIVESCYYSKKIRKIHVATKVFMALRIAVNQEFKNIKQFLNDFEPFLKNNGKVAILSFHSLEDRIVKNHFKEKIKKCICSEEKFICDCRHSPNFKKITKKPIIPSKKETLKNPRSRSAKLRIYQKIK